MPVGELAFLALVGVILLGSVGVLHVRAEPPDRVVSRTLMWLFALLVLFGVVIDGIHHLVFTAAVFDAPFTTLEDGGKLLSLSLVVGFLFAVTFCGHDPRLARLAVASVEGANRLPRRQLPPQHLARTAVPEPALARRQDRRANQVDCLVVSEGPKLEVLQCP